MLSAIKVRTIILFVLIASIAPGAKSLVTSGMPRCPLPTKKLALVDRDGVINEDVGAPGVVDLSQLELTKGAGIALGKLRREGYKVALITNQSCVGKGLITEADLRTIHQRMQELLLAQDQDAKFDEIFYCTSVKEDKDHRSKPNPGMIEEAMEIFGRDDDDDGPTTTTTTTTAAKAASAFDSIFFVGDTLTDLQAAATANVRTRILVETGYGRGIMRDKGAPGVDGTVQIVNEKDNNVDLTSIHSKNSDSDVPRASIFPFLYAKNFSSAVDYIIHATNETIQR